MDKINNTKRNQIKSPLLVKQPAKSMLVRINPEASDKLTTLIGKSKINNAPIKAVDFVSDAVIERIDNLN